MLATCHRRQRPRYSILEPQTMVNKAPPFRVHLKGNPFKGNPFTNHPYLSFFLSINQFIYLFIFFIFFSRIQNFYQFIHLFIFFFFIFFIHTHIYTIVKKIFREKNCKICVCKVAARNDNRNLQ